AGIEIRYYNVIYDLVDDLKAAMAGMLSPDLRETALGKAKVLEVFAVGKGDKAAGCLIEDGMVRRGAKVRLIRDDIVIHEGELSSLRRFKDEVKEVPSGQECGMAFENYADLKAGDIIEWSAYRRDGDALRRLRVFRLWCVFSLRRGVFPHQPDDEQPA
ncbi:hypothetical protein N9W88_05160, partial [Alphaproteobacteria bacterium]|nr:hypothetical protein [Alphaproteobacteria bacterium]